VMECSSIGLDQGRVELVDFDVAIFTNLGRDHLDYHESSESLPAVSGHLPAFAEYSIATLCCPVIETRGSPRIKTICCP
jgi:UDP-N-acetylmuramoyl-L-alanyl-D-glutamate--2,6-diaminopimelate ligase